MRIAVYSFCYNESLILPYFFRHYGQYTDDITIFDNQSTDNSVEIIKTHHGKVIPYETGNTFRDDVIAGIKNNCWKEKKGKNVDWVAVVDIDEFVYHPHLSDFLHIAADEGATLLFPRGYSMVSRELPLTKGQIYEQVNFGVVDDTYTKPVVFNPAAIEEINYTVGSHYFNPVGVLKPLTDPSLKLLHFHYLSLEHFLDRSHERAGRLSSENLKNRWGVHYLQSDARFAEEFNRLLARAEKVVNYYSH